ncbi:dimethyl sulfoxide reductase subunit A [Paraferrimonas sedimenticola]|uniref:Dimethyl sulfoxide reductase subunit A n=1 Tax=Paraferrimonas sedimenticola TaxID=375674 RepID=A0AA37RY52_9GAMM|nr:dimethyl sulfoxide reductase subunit A [Paraferrimonas sedimenticola]
MVNCGSNCPIKVITQDGNVVRIETDLETEDEYGVSHQARACARGRSLKQRTYAPDRLKTPLRRVGKRGEAKFEPISWDEAAAIFVENWQRIKNEYGPKSIFPLYGTGAYYGFASRSAWLRLLNLDGGYLRYYGNYSWAQQNEAASATWGGGSTNGTALSNLKDSDLMLAIAYNPSEIRQSGSGEGYDFLNQLEQNNGLEVIMVDPRYTDSMLGKENSWYPIRPGTDAIFIEAIAHEMISSGWVEQNSKAFIDKWTVGYDKASLEALKTEFENSGDATKVDYVKYIDSDNNYHDYIMGVGRFAADGPRTAAKAAPICGIPETSIKSIAQKVMNARAPYIITGAGVNRHANGEQAMRACYMLPILTGKIGQAGVNNGALPSQFQMFRAGLPSGSNPVTESISHYNWIDAIERGTEMTGRADGVRGTPDMDTKLGANIKMLMGINGNILINQHSDCNKTHELLQDESKVEFIMVCDCWMTPSARYADLVLPDTSWLESNDLANDSYASGLMGNLTMMSAAIDPLWECRSMFEMCRLFAAKAGFEGQYTEGKDEAAWLEELYQATKSNARNAGTQPAFPDSYVEAQKIGLFKKWGDSGTIAFADNINNNKPFGTLSGKLEIYSTKWAKYAAEWTLDTSILGNTIDPIPKYQVTWDHYEDTETREKYPLLLVGYHTKGRTHSSYHNVGWLREAAEDAVWMNPVDAGARGLSSGDKVHVYNDRGTIEVPVRVTPRIAPGVTALGQGAWFLRNGPVDSRNGKPIDKGGAVNTITLYRPTPVGKANPQHTNLVEITRA